MHEYLSIRPKKKRKIFGDGGYRSPYLSHAKRALYHLSYVPSYCLNVSITQCDCDCQVAIISHPMRNALLILQSHNYHTFDSSVGRAVDCSWKMAVIHRSLVQIRLEGCSFNQVSSCMTKQCFPMLLLPPPCNKRSESTFYIFYIYTCACLK